MRGSSGMVRLRRAAMVNTAALALMSGLVPCATAAQAQTVAPDQTAEFRISAGPVSEALRSYAEATGLQLIYDAELETAGASPGVSGQMSARDALARLLAGTGLSFRFVNGSTVTIETRAGGDGERVTGAVRVEGAQGSPYYGGAGQMAGVNGVNGSRDITATEGTGSFTTGALTIGSKVPRSIQETPQSVSAITSEQLEQQNINDYESALKQLPGISFSQGTSSLETEFYSRGFKVTSIQVDGGTPLTTNYGFFPQIDLSIYDHVELLRGAGGQFGGYGDPGGVVNLVRKKPLDHEQVTVELEAGSWNHFRTVLDVSAPLAFEGRLRGRAVATWQSNEHFYDLAEDDKTLLYGILEYDLTPSTVVTAGVSHTKQNSVPWQFGLPRYLNGDDVRLPRDTSFVFPWNRWNFDTTELFGGIEQRLGDEWSIRLNITKNQQTSEQKVGFSQGAVNPQNGLGPQFFAQYFDYGSDQFSAEAVLSGSFTIFGQRQEMTAGLTHVVSDGGGFTNYASPTNIFQTPYQPYPGGPVFCQDFGSGICPVGSIPTNPPINVFAFNPSDPLYTEPRMPLPTFRSRLNTRTQTTAFLNFRFTAFDRLHLDTGLRWSRLKYASEADLLCTTIPQTDPGFSPSCFGREIGDAFSQTAFKSSGDDFSWPPSASLSYDITDALTAYVGYTDIYQTQDTFLDANLNPLPPITGANWEVGAKWAARGGKLNVALSAYRIEQHGFGIVDPPDYSEYVEVSPGVYCCHVVDPNQSFISEGVDLEVTGEILRGWQISGSYTWNDNRYEGSSFGTSEGLPLVTIAPNHVYKLWTSYDFGAAGHTGLLANLTLSGGVNGQSAGYRAGSVCVNLIGSPDPITGGQECASFEPPDLIPYEFVVAPYAILSARADFRLNDRWSASIQGENLADKTYYATTAQEVSSGHWYGPPRSFTVSVRAKW